MYELRTVTLTGLEELGARVELREQPYGVSRPIVTSQHPRTNEALCAASLYIDGEPLAVVEPTIDLTDPHVTEDALAAALAQTLTRWLQALDDLPGGVLVPIMRAINLSNQLYGLTLDAARAGQARAPTPDTTPAPTGDAPPGEA
jgi:hypothetical protein